MPFIEFEFFIPEDVEWDVFIAQLDQLGFDSIWEDITIKAYMQEDNWDKDKKRVLDEWTREWPRKYTSGTMETVNWNAEWESKFDPVQIQDFCLIRASFHPANETCTHEIIIDPKMSFGTGHHETTSMMVEAMSEIDFTRKTVLDYGCGTGVLAILAAKMGASEVEGIEIDPMAVENAKENVSINQFDAIPIYEGDLDQARLKHYDIILANINRNVLLARMDDMVKLLSKEGLLLCSGVLVSDQNIMSKAIEDAGLSILDVRNQGEWLCFKAAL